MVTSWWRNVQAFHTQTRGWCPGVQLRLEKLFGAAIWFSGVSLLGEEAAINWNELIWSRVTPLISQVRRLLGFSFFSCPCRWYVGGESMSCTLHCHDRSGNHLETRAAVCPGKAPHAEQVPAPGPLFQQLALQWDTAAWPKSPWGKQNKTTNK